MEIKDKIIEHLNSNDGKIYLYVSKDEKNLNDVRINTNINVDFSKTNTKFIVLFPKGIGKVKGEINGGIYYDDDSLTEQFIKNSISLSSDAFIKAINSETKEVQE